MDALHDSMALSDWLAMPENEQEAALNLLWETVKKTSLRESTPAKSNFYGVLNGYEQIDPHNPVHRQFAERVFNIFAKVLNHYAYENRVDFDLHNVGQWQHLFPNKVRGLITTFLELHDDLPQNVIYNAQRALDGTYLTDEMRHVFVAKVERAFADVPYPADDWIVHDKNHCPECEELHYAYVGKQWQSLTDARYLRRYDGLSFFTPMTFRYFLPAFMRAAVTDLEGSDVIVSGIVFHLTPPSDADADEDWLTPEQRVAQKEWTAQRLIAFNFNREQIEVICDYIRLYVRLYEDVYDSALDGSLLALAYWQNQLQSTL